MSKSSSYPDHAAVRIDDDGLVTYHGVRLGQVLPTGRKYNNGREEFWTNNKGDFCYCRDHAAYMLALQYVRAKG